MPQDLQEDLRDDLVRKTFATCTAWLGIETEKLYYIFLELRDAAESNLL